MQINIVQLTLVAKYATKKEAEWLVKENIPVFNSSIDFSIKKISDNWLVLNSYFFDMSKIKLHTNKKWLISKCNSGKKGYRQEWC